jgi:hypothetical protein
VKRGNCEERMKNDIPIVKRGASIIVSKWAPVVGPLKQMYSKSLKRKKKRTYHPSFRSVQREIKGPRHVVSSFFVVVSYPYVIMSREDIYIAYK